MLRAGSALGAEMEEALRKAAAINMGIGARGGTNEDDEDEELWDAQLEIESIRSSVKKSFDDRGNIEYKHYAFNDFFDFL